MHPADIKAALEKREITQVDLAKELGCSQKTVSQVINKKAISNRIMKAVAAKIGRRPEEVFPEYYLNPPKRSEKRRVAV